MLQGITSFRFPRMRMFTLESLEEWLGGMRHTIGWWSMAYVVCRGQTRVVKCTFLLLIKKCYWDDKLHRAGYRTRCEFHAAAGKIVTDIRKFFTESRHTSRLYNLPLESSDFVLTRPRATWSFMLAFEQEGWTRWPAQVPSNQITLLDMNLKRN